MATERVSAGDDVKVFEKGHKVTGDEPVVPKVHPVKAAVVRTALKEMFESHRFSICTVDDCLKILGLHRGGEVYNLLNALHCIHYNNMEPDVKKWCFTATLQLLSEDGFELNRINCIGTFQSMDKKLEAPKREDKDIGFGFFRRLLGGGDGGS
jgi:hypothetical protein